MVCTVRLFFLYRSDDEGEFPDFCLTVAHPVRGKDDDCVEEFAINAKPRQVAAKNKNPNERMRFLPK